MKPYPLQLEISGPIATCLRRVRPGRQVWARPDTMPNPVSYVAPTSQHPLRLDRGEGRVRCRIQTNNAVPDYPGSESGFRNDPTPCATANHLIPTVLEMVFDQSQPICAN